MPLCDSLRVTHVLSATTSQPKGKLLRVLGFGFGIAVALGNGIGAGIMRTPSENAARLPSIWLLMLAWILGALFSLVGAWSLSEVGAMIPSAGAFYTVARRAYGDYVSFVVGWTDWLSLCGGIAVITLLAGEYIGNLVARSGGHTAALAAAVVLFVTVVQWRGIRWGSLFQDLTSAVTALVFFSLIVVPFLLLHRASASAAPVFTMPTGMPLFVAWILVLQAVIYTYDGRYSAIYFGDEFINPGVELPRSMINGALLVCAVGVFTNAALFYALDVSTIARENLPLAVLGRMILGERGPVLVRSFMTLTLVSIANATLLCTTRVLYAMSRDGWGLTRIAYVNRGGTPTVSLFLSTFTAIGFLLSGSFDRVLAVTAFFYVSKYLLSYLAVFILRRREPKTPRPYRAWGYPWTTAAAVLGSFAFLVGVFAVDTRNSLYGCLVLIASYPVYRFARRNAAISGPLIRGATPPSND
jgi:APA family basic amino acid/polyamine antiporter